jgi:hypothetical protein
MVRFQSKSLSKMFEKVDTFEMYRQRTTIMATTSKDKSSSMAIGQPQGLSLKGTVLVGEERILR